MFSCVPLAYLGPLFPALIAAFRQFATSQVACLLSYLPLPSVDTSSNLLLQYRTSVISDLRLVGYNLTACFCATIHSLFTATERAPTKHLPLSPYSKARDPSVLAWSSGFLISTTGDWRLATGNRRPPASPYNNLDNLVPFTYTYDISLPPTIIISSDLRTLRPYQTAFPPQPTAEDDIAPGGVRLPTRHSPIRPRLDYGSRRQHRICEIPRFIE